MTCNSTQDFYISIGYKKLIAHYSSRDFLVLSTELVDDVN